MFIPTIESLTFDTAAMRALPEKSTASRRIWVTPEQDVVLLNLYLDVPDIPASLDRLDSLRVGYRQMAADNNVALIEAEVVDADSYRAILRIVRFHLESRAAVYIASLILPFRDFSFVLKAQCEERGLTGMREAVVFADSMSAGVIDINPERESRGGGMLNSDDLMGWVSNPDGPSPRTEPPRSIAEDEKYDAQFPDHPLSRAHRLIRHLQSTLVVAPQLKAAASFEKG